MHNKMEMGAFACVVFRERILLYILTKSILYDVIKYLIYACRIKIRALNVFVRTSSI